MLSTVFFNQSLNSTLIEALMVSTSNYEMRDSLFLGIDASFNLKFRIAYKTKKSRFPSPNLGIIQIHLLLQTTGLKKLYNNRTICPTNTAPASPLGNLSTIMKKATYLCNPFFCSSFDRLESTSVRRFQFSLSGIRTLTDLSLTSWLAE